MVVYSPKNSYIYEISNNYKLNVKAVYDATFFLCLKGAVKLILPRKGSKNVLREVFVYESYLLIVTF